MNIKQQLSFYVGSDENFPLEHRFFNLLSFFGGIISVLTVVVNLILDANFLLTLSTVIAIFACWAAFYLSRFRRNFLLGKWILTTFLFLLFGYIFFINNGSRGPILYLYMVFFLLILFVWQGRARVFFVGFFILNIFAYLLIEYILPEATKPYEAEKIRLLDVYLSYFLYIVLLGAIIMFAKNGYVREKLKAERSDQLKTSFLANMSHEIRTPMNAILGFTQLLENDLSRDKKEAYLKVIKENGQSLLRLIEDIIDVSKIEAGELKIHNSETNIDSILADLVSTFNYVLQEYPEKSIHLKSETSTEGLVIMTDGTRLKQILSNLIHNSIKYTESGSITFGFAEEEGNLRFFVRDTGHGIRAEHLDEIFDRFRKIETVSSKKIQPGTGIGLSISKNLAELLGGSMHVSSKYGNGSEFYFNIPNVPVRIHKEEIARVIAPQNSEIPDLSGKVILVAEDENANFFFLNKVLERTGAKVIRARNGREAVEICRANLQVDFILMDILMPDLNGYQATAIIKQEYPGIPIIAQTALAMEGDAQQVLDAGCDAYISKPIRIKTLFELVSTFMVKESIN